MRRQPTKSKAIALCLRLASSPLLSYRIYNTFTAQFQNLLRFVRIQRRLWPVPKRISAKMSPHCAADCVCLPCPALPCPALVWPRSYPFACSRLATATPRAASLGQHPRTILALGMPTYFAYFAFYYKFSFCSVFPRLLSPPAPSASSHFSSSSSSLVASSISV